MIDPTVYVVQSAATNADGSHAGTFNHFVTTEARALEECAKAPGRKYRALPLSAVPASARAGLARVLGV